VQYICLSYVGEEGWNAMSESQRNAALDEVFAYTDELRASGHLLAAEGLQSARPYVETKEKIGGLYVLA